MTMEAAREFIFDNIYQTASYKAKSLMDIADIDVSVRSADEVTFGVMDVSGEVIRRKYSDTMSDERFYTNINAFFQNPQTKRIYADQDFGYRDTRVRYRWVNGRIVMD
jgi:hypothetical protein